MLHVGRWRGVLPTPTPTLVCASPQHFSHFDICHKIQAKLKRRVYYALKFCPSGDDC